MKILILFAIIAIFSSCASTPKQAEGWLQRCTQTDEVSYCVTKTGNKVDKTIVFLHGLLDGVQSPKKSIYALTDLVDRINESGASHVVNISFGKNWMLRPDRDQIKTYKKILDSLNVPKARDAACVSQGCHNLVTLNYVYPDTFGKITFIVPMLLRNEDYEKKFNILDPKNAGALVGGHFSRKDWAKYNPFSLGFKGKGFGVVCSRDDFGLNVQGKEFFIKNQVEFKEYDCTHNSANMSEVKL